MGLVPAADPRDRPIAVFDSGVGGLTVLHELLVSLPQEDYVYLGDSARFPYGERTQEELESFGMDIAEELVARRAKLLIVACNSMTAAALPALQRRMLETTLGVDVIGVVKPEAAQAVAVTRSGRIGLLATRATVASGAYERAVAAVDPHVDLVAVPCPDLAPLIQDPPGGELFSRELEDVVRGSCSPLVAAGVDTVILGCTHYPLVRSMLQRARRDDRDLRCRARAPGRARPRLARPRLAPHGRGHLLVPVHRRRHRVPRARHALPADAADRGRARRARRGAGPADAHHHRPRGARMAATVTRSYDRAADAARPVTIEPGFVRTASGSALISMGETRVICTASAQAGVPRWRMGSGLGWVTAEYGMLPASTGERKQRDATRGKVDGRTVEIQRLIGRSIRAVVDFQALGERTLWVDCDVLQADGGTRCASICGAYVASKLALERFGLGRALTDSVAAVSVGIVEDTPLLDLDYSEDSTAEVDMNVVMTGDGRLVEVQATAEGVPFSRERLDEQLTLAERGIGLLGKAQTEAVERALQS